MAWGGSIARSGFSFDDAEILFDNPVVSGALPWWSAFERDYWHHRGDAGHWRPSAILSLRFDRRLWGRWAPGYHLTNVLLHALVVWLLCRLWRGAASALPWAGIALFCAHPALADSVAWISGRTSMLSAAGGLLGAVWVLELARDGERESRWHGPQLAFAACAGLLLALAGKEDGLAFAPLYVLLAYGASREARDRGPLLFTCAGCGLAVLLWLGARAYALGDALPHAPFAPLAGAGVLERLQTSGLILTAGLRLIAAPFDYPPDYSAADLAISPDALSWIVGLLALAFWSSLLIGGLRFRGHGPLALSAVMVALCVLPVLQIIPSGELFAPRFLYLPLLFAAPLVHAAFLRATSAPTVRLAVGTLALSLMVALAWQRAGVYADRGSYREAVLAHQPLDAPSWNDLGIAREENGDAAGALGAWRRALEIDPRYSRAWSNLGRLQAADRDLEAAEFSLRRAVEEGPRNPIAHCNLGALLLRRDAPDEAADHYRRATTLAPGMSATWRGLGNAELRRGERATATRALERALGLDPRDIMARTLLERARSREPASH